MAFISSSTKQHLQETVQETIVSAKGLSSKLQPQDVVGMFIFFALLPASFLFEITFVFNFWFPTLSEAWLTRVLLLLYLASNVYLNAFFLMWKGPNGGKSDLPSVMRNGFVYCHSCGLNSPPRSHHCPVCDRCVMRRDHHCSFISCCVGHFNQRYFIAAVANLWLICLTCCYYNWSLLEATVPRTSLVHYWKLIIPHIALAVGTVSFYQFFVTVVFISSLTTLMFVTYLCTAQLFCIVRGQTRVEYLQDVQAYNLGFLENLHQVLGERWPLVFTSPLIPSPLQSDGISFKTKEMENVFKQSKSL